MYYLIDRQSNKIRGIYATYDEVLTSNVSNYLILEDVSVKLVSRVAFVDNKCIYNNIQFWSNDYKTIIDDYENHEVVDFMGLRVDKNRFINEAKTNGPKTCSIDSRPGQILYNMNAGQEFISLFREECILTNFSKDSGTSPMNIFKKLETVISMLNAGAFREAKQFLQEYREELKDAFLTDERIDKYIAMLDAADAIEYATDEEYFCTVSEETEG